MGDPVTGIGWAQDFNGYTKLTPFFSSILAAGLILWFSSNSSDDFDYIALFNRFFRFINHVFSRWNANGRLKIEWEK